MSVPCPVQKLLHEAARFVRIVGAREGLHARLDGVVEWLCVPLSYQEFLQTDRTGAGGTDGSHPGLCRVVELEWGHDPVDQSTPFGVRG